jgi:hypothetical protein
MIPARTVLRAAVVAALRGDGVPRTMAGIAVFDSRMEELVSVTAETLLPTVLVYTDQDKRTNHAMKGGRAFKRSVVLVIEAAIQRVAADSTNMIPIETDAEHEFLLDCFEGEIERALLHDRTPQAIRFRGLIQSIDEWDSQPMRSADQAHKYAARQIVIDLCLSEDCFSVTGDVAAQAPYLAPFVEALQTAENFGSTRSLLAGPPLGYGAGAPLRGASIKADFVDPADPQRLAALNRTQGPDGRVEIEASATMEGSS